MIASSTGASAQSRSIEHDLPPFEGLEVSDGFKITLSKGDSYSAKLTMDDALESYVQCYVKAGVLHIGIDSKNADIYLEPDGVHYTAEGRSLYASKLSTALLEALGDTDPADEIPPVSNQAANVDNTSP